MPTKYNWSAESGFAERFAKQRLAEEARTALGDSDISHSAAIDAALTEVLAGTIGGQSGGVNAEVIAARGSTASLSARLTQYPADGAVVPGGGRTVTALKQYLANNAVFNVKDFGATGDGVADDTAAIQAAIDACQAAGYGYARVPRGTYKLTNTLAGTGSTIGSAFKGVDIIGDSLQAVTFSYPTFATKKAAIKYQGGSGQLAGIRVRGITFSGSATSVGVECNSQDWVSVEDCAFGTNAVGILFSNDSAGGFTEYCVARRCRFDNGCTNPVEYFVGAGDESFHGSGMVDCLVNLNVGNNVVKIGAGALPYNAPMSFICWVNDATLATTLMQNSSGKTPNFHGDIRTEGQSTLGGGGTIYLRGSVSCLTNTSLGTLVADNKLVQFGPEGGSLNGSTYEWRRPFYKAYGMVPGANTTVSAQTSGCLLVYVRFDAANYDYRYALIVTHEGVGGAGFVTTLATIRAFNAAGYGAPTFSVDTSGNLVITNATFPASGVTAAVHVTPLGLSGASAILPTW